MTPIKLVATLQTLGRFTQMKTLEEITAEGPGGGAGYTLQCPGSLGLPAVCYYSPLSQASGGALAFQREQARS